MRVCVTGATGFLGAHVAAAWSSGRRGAGHRPGPPRLAALAGRDVEVVDADVLDRRSMRRALDGCDILFHTAGMVASRPRREVWRVNAIGPRIAVETAAECGVRRVVITSSVASIGPGRGRPAGDRAQCLPEHGHGLLYTDSKYEGERGALAAGARGWGSKSCPCVPRTCSGPALNRARAGETSTRIVANYLRGRLPAIVDAYTNIVDVEDVAAGPSAGGRAWAAGRAVHPRRGEPALVGGDRADRTDLRSAAPADRAAARGRRRRRRAEARWRSLRPARGHSPDGAELALLVRAARERELGYRPRRASETLERTVAWYQELIEDERLAAPAQQVVRPYVRRRTDGGPARAALPLRGGRAARRAGGRCSE